jgi:hypothetical protein
LVKILTKSKHCPLRLSPDEEKPDVDGDDEVAVEEDEEPDEDVGHDHVDVHEHHGSGAGEIHFPIFFIFFVRPAFEIRETARPPFVTGRRHEFRVFALNQ